MGSRLGASNLLKIPTFWCQEDPFPTTFYWHLYNYSVTRKFLREAAAHQRGGPGVAAAGLHAAPGRFWGLWQDRGGTRLPDRRQIRPGWGCGYCAQAGWVIFYIVNISVGDPGCFLGPPGSGSVSQRYGSGSGSFYHRAKIVRKTLTPTDLWPFYDFYLRKLCKCTVP